MPLWKLRLKKLEVAFSRSKVDGLIFESQAMADLAIYVRGFPTDKISIMPLGINTALFGVERGDYAYKTFRLPTDRKIVVYAGHIGWWKGIGTLVEAAIEILVRRRRPDVCFLICGITEDQSKEYEQVYSGLHIEKLICFGGVSL